ncbi:MAG: hypothetical protein HQL86_00085 [Magnetococcales bacterium]|nr:hypothetical protein [Magnetococcales bacterium]
MSRGARSGLVVTMLLIGCTLASQVWAFGEEKPVHLPNQEGAFGPSESDGGIRLWGNPRDSGAPEREKPLHLMEDGPFQQFEEAPQPPPPAPPGKVGQEKRRLPPGKRDEGSRPPPQGSVRSMDRAGEGGVSERGRKPEKAPNSKAGSSDVGTNGPSSQPAIERIEQGFMSGEDPLFAPSPSVLGAPGRPGREPPPDLSGEIPSRGVLTLPAGPLTDPSPSGEGWNPGSEWYGQDGNPWR